MSIKPEFDNTREGVFAMTGRVLDVVADTPHVSWKKLDSVPTQQTLDTAIGCIMANELELAIFGLMYVLFQRRFEPTNQADKKLKELFGETKNVT